MKKPVIAGNWKSNKTIEEAQAWRDGFSGTAKEASVILFVPYTALSTMKGGPYELGAQDVSAFDNGAYTGAVSARMLLDLATWVLIGHSERRKYFSETDDVLKEKVTRAKNAGLQVVFCVPDDKTPIPSTVDIVAYEPVWAIGTGKADTPENASKVIRQIKETSGITTVLYGGSVTQDNISQFMLSDVIDGVLVGGASLDPKTFLSLIEKS